MSVRVPIYDANQLDFVDAKESYEGYLDGFHGEPEPGDNRSDSYWHGWRNGAVDGGHREADEAQRLLAKSVVASWKGNSQ